jgi:outer membrane protein assembly factor BamD (BamD/ComL family)
MTTPQSGHILRSLRPLLMGGVVAVLLLVVLAGCRSTPRFQGMETQQVYEMGRQDLEEEEWDDAIEAFERVLTTDPGFPRRAEARF